MEGLVAPCFTRFGFEARRRMFDWRRLDSYRLAGRVIVVTGATSGLGLAAATQLAHDGATVVALGRSPDKTARVVQELRDATTNPNLSAVIADMGDFDSVRRACERILADHDRLDVVIHNAGALSHRRTVAPDGTEATIASQMRDGSSDVTTSIDLPAGTDPAAYDVVDVSVQADGAGPEHSGNSVLRGALSA